MRATGVGARVSTLARRAFSQGRRPIPEPKPSEAHQSAATTMYRKQRPEPVRAANPMNPAVAPQPVAKTSIHTTVAREAPPATSRLKPDLHQMKPPKSAAHIYREQRMNKSSSAGEPPKTPGEGRGTGPAGPGGDENATARNIGVLGVLAVAGFSLWWYYTHKDPLEDFYRQESAPDVEPLTAEDLQINNPQAQQPLWLQRPRDSS